MSQSIIQTANFERNRVRLETLTLIRSVAILGQILSVLIAAFLFDIVLNFIGFAVVIGASVVLNLYFTLKFSPNTRLRDREATFVFIYDVLQLSALLYLSGGLHNPFALMILAPVAVAASALRPRYSSFVAFAAIIGITFVSAFNVSLIKTDGTEILVSNTLLLGHWLAILIGVMFMGLFSWRVSSEIDALSDALMATQMALTREQELTDIGGVVAAAAHELGTPLATIKLLSAEIADELSDKPHLKEDAELIRAQAAHCGDILKSMGRKSDSHMQTAPLQAVVEEAATPHMERGKTVLFELLEEADAAHQPYIIRSPEIIHGLRNLIQNAVDFSKSTVWIEMWWSSKTIGVRIMDDGKGYPAGLIGRLGDPFLGQKTGRKSDQSRPEYEGMGLGLFIAKTLLERQGAEISFRNNSEKSDRGRGAVVTLTWPRARITQSD